MQIYNFKLFFGWFLFIPVPDNFLTG